MKIQSLEKLFVVLLSDIYAAETSIALALPLMAKKAQSKELKEALQNHLKETKEQIARIERIFAIIEDTPVNVEWLNNMRSLFEKGNKFLEDNAPSPVTDAAIIAVAQRVEHYEIATYGTLREFADCLEYDEVKDLIKDSLKEELAADSTLNKIAMGGIFSAGVNVKAVAGVGV